MEAKNTLIVAPQYNWARLVAMQEQLDRMRWHYVHAYRDLFGWEPKITEILIHEEWLETPMRRVVVEEGKSEFRYPMTEQISVLRELGATVRYVRT